MPNISHWLSPSALVSFLLTGVLSGYAALQPGAPAWLFAVAAFAPLLVWFVVARQARVAADARSLATESVASMKRLAELTGVIANRPPHVLTQAIAERDAENRNAIINQLTQVYVLMHRDVSQDVIDGSEPPPLEWLNDGLDKLGLNWRVRITNEGELESYTL